MINARTLIKAKMDTSGNDLLRTIFDTVSLYVNGQSDGSIAKNDRYEILERILVGVGMWLTSHPPHNSPKNNDRWKAMEELANEVAAEAKVLGVRFLTGPSDWKSIGAPGPGKVHVNNVVRSYWLEMLSSDYGVGYVLTPLFKTWMATGGPEQSFWEYVRLKPPNNEHVQYFSGVQAELYRVEFRADGKLCRVHDGALYDTTLLETAASGDGWAIFVVSPQGKLYSYKHEVGVFHHSSFLSGSAVMAAGEMLVVNGEIRIINSKSGHYIPMKENMHNMVKIFPDLPRNAIILPDFSKRPFPAYTISDYRFSGENAKSVKRAKILEKLTPTANNPTAIGWINNVAA